MSGRIRARFENRRGLIRADYISTPPPATQERASSSALKALAGLLAVFGVGSVLYGIGFLVLRSHYAFLGIWGGATWNTTEIAEEGGTFFYHLIYVPVSLLLSLSLRKTAVLTLVALVLAVGWEQRHAVSDLASRFKIIRYLQRSSLARLLRDLLLILLILILTSIILETVWKVSELSDVLRSPENLCKFFQYDDCQHVQSARESVLNGFYYEVFVRTLIAVFLGVCLYCCFWANSRKLLRVLIVAQWLLVLSALFMLPVAYGKLLLPAEYREVGFANSTNKQTLVLIGQMSDAWVVWDLEQKKTRVLPRNDFKEIVIGKEINLLR